MEDKVVVIFDPGFGEKLLSVIGPPIWIIDSADNDLTARELWNRKVPGITTFRPQRFVDLLDTIDQHHPRWRTLEIIGESLTDEARDEARNYSASAIAPTAVGFVVKRTAS
jgi:hypothetical protein